MRERADHELLEGKRERERNRRDREERGKGFREKEGEVGEDKLEERKNIEEGFVLPQNTIKLRIQEAYKHTQGLH